jgi:hypothetical protein
MGLQDFIEVVLYLPVGMPRKIGKASRKAKPSSDRDDHEQKI